MATTKHAKMGTRNLALKDKMGIRILALKAKMGEAWRQRNTPKWALAIGVGSGQMATLRGHSKTCIDTT